MQQQLQERLHDGQALLNQREEYIFNRSQESKRFEKELEDIKLSLEKEKEALNEKKQTLNLEAMSLSAREEVKIMFPSLSLFFFDCLCC